MNRAVRATLPPRVTSDTVTTPRLTETSTRRPALVAVTSYVRVSPPASTTISTRSPFTIASRFPCLYAMQVGKLCRQSYSARMTFSAAQDRRYPADPAA
jgi:hypothetical protein